MSDDNKEFADDPRSEQPKQIEHSDKAITYPHGKVDLTASKEDGDDELGAGGFPGEEVERFEELARFIGSSWSGMLPPPDEFKAIQNGFRKRWWHGMMLKPSMSQNA